MLAYSSINHLGYCLLAIFAVATPAIGVIAPVGAEGGRRSTACFCSCSTTA